VSARASYPTCNHTHPTGNRCGSPALQSEQFCFYHHPTRRPPQRTTPQSFTFELSPITDREDLQINLSEILRRLADNTIDTRRASLLLHTLEMASANLAAAGGFQVRTLTDLSGPAPGLSPQLTALFPQL
jgi:hypothetical protein